MELSKIDHKGFKEVPIQVAEIGFVDFWMNYQSFTFKLESAFLLAFSLYWTEFRALAMWFKNVEGYSRKNRVWVMSV